MTTHCPNPTCQQNETCGCKTYSLESTAKAERIAEIEDKYQDDCDRLEIFYASFPPYYNGANMAEVQQKAQKRLDDETLAKIKLIEGEE